MNYEKKGLKKLWEGSTFGDGGMGNLSCSFPPLLRFPKPKQTLTSTHNFTNFRKNYDLKRQFIKTGKNKG
jgi:hypothetical protein